MVKPAESNPVNTRPTPTARELAEVDCEVIPSLLLLGRRPPLLRVAPVPENLGRMRRRLDLDGQRIVRDIDQILVLRGGLGAPELRVPRGEFQRNQFMEKECHDLRLGEQVLSNPEPFWSNPRFEDRIPRPKHYCNYFIHLQRVATDQFPRLCEPLRPRHPSVG